MNEQAGLWRPRPEPGGSSAGMAGRGAGASGGELLITAATVSGVPACTTAALTNKGLNGRERLKICASQ